MMTLINPPYKRTLCVTDLSCSRGERRVLDKISLDTKPGSVILLRGANGAGKSTLLMCLAQLLDFEGRITSLGGDPDDLLTHDMHFISHLPALKANLSVTENLHFWAQMNGGDVKKIPAALISARLDHAATLDAGNLSAGQTRRLSLLRLLVAPRAIWLLDEPTSALDSQGEKWIAGLIDAHVAQNGIAIIATHLDLPLTVPTTTFHIGEK